MPADVTLDPATGIWTLTLRGALEAAEVARAIGGMYASPDYRPEAPRMYDVREVEDTIRTHDLRALAHRKEFLTSVRQARSAIVVAKDVTFGIARMYQSWMEGQPVDVRIFHAVEEARAWLRRETD